MGRRFCNTALALTLLLVTSVGNVASADVRKGRFYFEKRGEALWQVPTGKKAIALTFDDGPDPIYTKQILDILKHDSAHATFFVIGSHAQRWPALLQQEIRDGHEVENHTYSHRRLRHQSTNVIRQEIQQTRSVVKQLVRRNTIFFRPPGGYYDETIVNASKAEGCTVVLWSWDEDSKDWTNPGVGRIVKTVVSNADDGDIVLMHDRGSGNRKQTIEALRLIIPKLKEQGFQFVTISQMLQLHNQSPGWGGDRDDDDDK